MNVSGEPQQLVSTVLCNRLPLATSDPVQYWAVLVSLEGFAGYLAPTTTPVSSSATVNLVALACWSFTSLPDPAVNFQSLSEGLVSWDSANGGTLTLPVSSPPDNANVAQYLGWGYVPLDYHAFGTRTFAWYRGPFTPFPAQTIESVGTLGVPFASATSSDALLVYIADQGLFDIRYAAAWNLGRGLALASGSFSQALLSTRQQAARSLALLATRMGMPAFEAESDAHTLLSRGAARRRFLRLLNEGLAQRWTGGLLAPERTPSARQVPRAADWRALLQRPDVVEAIGGTLPLLETVLEFLLGLATLESVPFSYLVPNMAMLPAESIAFFYVDGQWIEAMFAGATSLGIQSELDQELQLALRPRMLAGMSTSSMTGMLIHSQLVSDFPAMNITALDGNQNAVTILRDETIGNSIRLVLFDGAPNTVNLTEPYHSLQFGVQDNGVVLRALTGTVGAPTGSSLPTANPTFDGFLAQYCTGGNGVIAVTSLAGDMPGVGSDGGRFAMQLLDVPEQQPFTQS